MSNSHYVYIIQDGKQPHIKVGISVDPNTRLRSIESQLRSARRRFGNDSCFDLHLRYVANVGYIVSTFCEIVIANTLPQIPLSEGMYFGSEWYLATPEQAIRHINNKLIEITLDRGEMELLLIQWIPPRLDAWRSHRRYIFD